MKQHKLGPNGAIMTSLNLFCTQFDQVLQILEERSFSTSTPATTTTHPLLDYIIVDTPGQIEAFTYLVGIRCHFFRKFSFQFS